MLLIATACGSETDVILADSATSTSSTTSPTTTASTSTPATSASENSIGRRLNCETQTFSAIADYDINYGFESADEAFSSFASSENSDWVRNDWGSLALLRSDESASSATRYYGTSDGDVRLVIDAGPNLDAGWVVGGWFGCEP